jgi:CRP/FNR family transcriptional regulator, anaerobic regulatory protein
MDSINSLLAYLKLHSSLKPVETEIVCSYFRKETLGREKSLFMQGQRYKKIVFTVEGILRVFIIDPSGEEIVKNFIEANEFFSEIESFEKDLPSVINVSAVTDCTLLTLSKVDSDKLIKELPQWEYQMKLGEMQAMSEMIRKQNFLRIGDSADKYRYFVENFPSLAQQVPLKYIASYLRVTQSSLSRIRKQGW